MSDLHAQFETATQEAKALPKTPSNENLLLLYSYYKQATAGDVSGKRPGFTNMVGRAKYDAWENLKGTSQDDAMQAYIDLVKALQNE
ncbi:MAG: acyl-CoA-binding protein [Anaerolineae bacterium]|nr:acyl-CoA-binding protein [Anaerolineae bacterium]